VADVGVVDLVLEASSAEARPASDNSPASANTAAADVMDAMDERLMRISFRGRVRA
jgi:hypothetical protein